MSHEDSCPQRHTLLDLFDADLAALGANAGRPFNRPIAQVERDHLAACGWPIARRDRHRWRVRVHQLGPDGVRRVIRQAGVLVAEFIDEPEPTTGGAR
jgi:hypothetical protein